MVKLPLLMSFSAEEVDREIRSMDKFAKKGWAHGYADGTMTPRGKTIQNMLRELKIMKEGATICPIGPKLHLVEPQTP